MKSAAAFAVFALLAAPCAATAVPPVSLARTDYASESTPFAAATGDVNGDLVPDLAVVNYGANSVSVRLGLGGGAFSPPADYATGLNPVSVAIGDLNSDGIPELVVCNWGSSTISILPGLGGGDFGPKSDLPAGGSRPISCQLAYLDYDNNLDLVFALRNSGLVQVRLGDGAGGFYLTLNFGTGAVSYPYSLALGDMNADGQLDLAVGTDVAGTQVEVMFGTGGSFYVPVAHTVGTQPVGVALGDVNNDGSADLIAAAQADGVVSVLLADGTGGFGPKTDFYVGSGPFSVVHGYFNGDTHRDLAVVNAASNSISILRGDGFGNFWPSVTFATGNGPRIILAAELNGDQRPDLVVPDAISNQVSVYLNTSDTSELFCPPGIVANGDFARGIVTGPMPPQGSVDSWSVLSQTPQVLFEGCQDPGSIQAWGNQVVGESVRQHLPGAGIQAGKTYAISVCYRWLDAGNPVLPQYVRFRLTASTSMPAAYPPPAGYTVIGITPNTSSTSWTTYTFPLFTAPANASWITVNPENDYLINDGEFVSWGLIDNICIQDINSPTSGVAAPVAINGGVSARSLTLLQAGPNPWRGEAAVRFALSSPQEVELTVLDVTGAVVHREGTARLAAGTHEFRWDSVLPDGRVVPSGVYYYRVVAGAETVSGALVRVR